MVLLGFGRVGRALADQIAAANGDARVRVVGLLDRSGYVFEPRGLSQRRLLGLTRQKDRGALLATLGGRRAAAADALTFMASHAVSRPLLVDVTSEETADLLREALEHGFDLVLANKKPIAGSWEQFEELFKTAAACGRQIRYEATVGAGLPILDTYQKLAETGDRVLRMEGCVSGTLMFIASAVSAGGKFSDAVRDAVHRGYAEPDPRDDLSGRDAARKALILARLLGYRGPAPVADDLVPRALAKLAPAEFHEAAARRSTPSGPPARRKRPPSAACFDTSSRRPHGLSPPGCSRCQPRARPARSAARETSSPSPRAAIAPSRSSSAAPAPAPKSRPPAS